MRGQNAFQFVAGRGADELAGFGREDFVDGARVLALDRFAGQDHGAAVDIGAAQAGVVIGVVHKMGQLVRVDGPVRQERRQHDRRAPQNFPLGHHEAAGQTLGQALQQHPREQQVRGGAADVDADRAQFYRFLFPDRLRDLGAVGFREPLMFVIEIDIVRHAESLAN